MRFSDHDRFDYSSIVEAFLHGVLLVQVITYLKLFEGSKCHMLIKEVIFALLTKQSYLYFDSRNRLTCPGRM